MAEGNAGVDNCGIISVIDSVEKKKETKNPPLLYNLAELQNDCSKLFKISPDQTLQIVQELYEKKLVTYPRTDARVLSTAVCKEIHKNIGGLRNYALARDLHRRYLRRKCIQVWQRRDIVMIKRLQIIMPLYLQDRALGRWDR